MTITTATPPARRERRAGASNQQHQDRRYWGSMEAPTAKASFFSAVTSPAADGDGTVATIRMYGPIDSWGGWWGISAEDMARVLDALPASVEQIVLRINSPGGEVWEAMAILSMLGAHRATVTAVVDGIAASAASFIAAGCAETVMSKGSQMMLHSPLCISWGNAADMRKTADFLDVMEASCIEIYTEKAGNRNWPELLAAETWLTAAAAVELGLADRIDVVSDAGPATTVGVADDEDDEDVLIVLVDEDPEDFVSARIKAVAATARASAPKPPSSTEPGNPIRKENVVTNDAPQAGDRQRLGTTDAAATEETAPAATVVEDTTPTPAPTAQATSAPAALLEGMVAVDANLWQETQRNAQRGAEAREQQDKDRRDGIIASAISTGRISPKSAENFRKMLDTDETGTASALASLQPNTAIPVTELGHGIGDPEDATAYPSHWKR
ncbi:hypothetical protein CH252_19120 [Rhodococcus sp. 06-1477-1B]|nr:hypothetical protein CH252_19120 [Rhodococcus sp. 06-1477-1B]